MKQNSINELKFHYKSLPKVWAGYDRDMFSISQDKLDNLKQKLLGITGKKQLNLFIKDGCGLLVKETFDDIDYFGIDFKNYFDKTFEKENIKYQVDADIVVIYNVGLEKALNTDFSAKLLLGLMKQFQDQNKIVIIDTHLAYNDFYRKYQIEFVNKLSINKKSEEKIF